MINATRRTAPAVLLLSLFANAFLAEVSAAADLVFRATVVTAPVRELRDARVVMAAASGMAYCAKETQPIMVGPHIYAKKKGREWVLMPKKLDGSIPEGTAWIDRIAAQDDQVLLLIGVQRAEFAVDPLTPSPDVPTDYFVLSSTDDGWRVLRVPIVGRILACELQIANDRRACFSSVWESEPNKLAAGAWMLSKYAWEVQTVERISKVPLEQPVRTGKNQFHVTCDGDRVTALLCFDASPYLASSFDTVIFPGIDVVRHYTSRPYAVAHICSFGDDTMAMICRGEREYDTSEYLSFASRQKTIPQLSRVPFPEGKVYVRRSCAANDTWLGCVVKEDTSAMLPLLMDGNGIRIGTSIGLGFAAGHEIRNIAIDDRGEYFILVRKNSDCEE